MRFSDSISWSTLRGPAKYALLANADKFLCEVLPDTRSSVVLPLWMEFKKIYDLANERRVLTETEINDVQVRRRKPVFLRLIAHCSDVQLPGSKHISPGAVMSAAVAPRRVFTATPI